MTTSSIITFLCILFLLVVVHELGHFLLAKFFKMRVDEFAFGFPPTVFQKKFKDTIYSFNLIPLGGFVKIFGENGLTQEELEKLTPHEKSQLFGQKIWWQRIIVLCGGVLFNIVAAFVLFVSVFMIGSNVYLDKSEIKSVDYTQRKLVLLDMNAKSPLINSSIETGDNIIAFEADGQKLETNSLDSFSASEFVQTHNNSQITITFLDKENNTKQVTVVPKAGIVEGKKILGAKFADSTFKKYSFFEAIPQAAQTTYDQLTFIFSGLYQLVSDMIYKNTKLEDNLSGPIGLAVMTAQVASHGFDQVLAFAAMLSLSLAAFNILPIPALDGGRVLFVLFELAKGKKVNASTEQLFHGIGFLALLCLMIFVTYFDIVKALADAAF